MAYSIGPTIGIEGEKEFRDSLKAINDNLKTLKSEMGMVAAAFDKDDKSKAALTTRNEILNKQIDEQKTKIEMLRFAVEQSTEKHGAASDITQKWQRDLNNATAALTKMERELGQNNDALRDVERGYNEAGDKLDEFGRVAEKSTNSFDVLASALAAAGVAKGISEISQALRECADASVEFESAIAGVKKTVDGTPEQLAAIRDGIKQMTTEIPASTTEIAGVAEAAGQLGVATDDVLAFTRTMIDLGESTNLTAEEAATSLAKFANITGIAAKDYDRLGSSIVALGNNSATTERDIVAMATRLASAGTLAGMTEQEIIALSAAMSSVGIEAEAGGTAMTQTLAAIQKAVAKGGEDLEKFAKISGMTGQEFAQTWNASPIEAIRAFTGGLGELKDQGESAVLALDDMGLSGVRQSNMLQSLALASDKLVGAVDLSNQAWAENTALANEVATRYATTESRMAMAANAANNLKIAIGDALTPALGELADMGTGAFAWAADFIEKNPELVQAITAVIAAAAVLAIGLTGFGVAAAHGAAAMTALSAAVAAFPGGALALAITGVVVALGTFIAMQASTKSETQQLTERLKEQKRAHEELKESIAQEDVDTKTLISSLEAMLAVEGKSEVQKLAILKKIEELNAALPGLGLSYDSATDSISMNANELNRAADAAARQKDAAADAELLSKAYTEQSNITTLLNDAKLALYEAEQAQAEAQKNGADETAQYDYVMGMYVSTVDDANIAVEIARRKVEDLTAKQEENNATIEELSTAEETETEVKSEQTRATEAATIVTAGLTEAHKELAEATESLSSVQDDLTKALTEQKKEGSLSLKTTMDLIEAGYAAAISSDAETGAVKLNQAAYIAIAQAKIAEQEAAIETQRISLNSAIAMKEEAILAQYNAEGYLNLARAKAAEQAIAKDGDLTSARAQLAALDAQSAALKNLKNNLDNYSYTAATTSKTRASAAKAEKTQAEKDLAEYKQLKADLDHERAMELIDEGEYYRRLLVLADQYLKDKSNQGEYRKAQEENYKYETNLAKEAVNEKSRIDKEAAEEKKRLDKEVSDEAKKATTDSLKEYQDQVKSMSDSVKAELDEMTKAWDDLNKEQDAMSSKLSAIGGLFEKTTSKYNGQEFFTVRDLKKDTEQIEEYGKALEELKARGTPEELLKEVQSMSIEDGKRYAESLLKMSDDKYDEYIQSWQKKQEAAKKVAEDFYKDELDELKTKFTDEVPKKLDGLKDQFKTLGEDMAKALAGGFAGQEDFITGQFADAINNAIRAVNSNIATPVAPWTYQQAATSGESAAVGGNAITQRDIITNVTLELDGDVLARKQYIHNQREGELHGGSLVN